MVRAPSPCLRVTFSSACLATDLALATITSVIAADASLAPDGTVVAIGATDI